jgi:hypothetical protein
VSYRELSQDYSPSCNVAIGPELFGQLCVTKPLVLSAIPTESQLPSVPVFHFAVSLQPRQQFEKTILLQ